MLFRGNSPFSACAALRARQPPCSKCAHRKVRFSVAGIKLIWVQRHAAALCFSAEIHPFPPALRFVQGSRLAQSALTEKCDFRWRELNFIWVQRHAATFHVFAKAKTFHFCAEDMLAYCSLLSAQKFHSLCTLMPDRRYMGTLESAPLRTSLDGDDAIIKSSLV